MYPTQVEQLQARVTALEAMVASLVEILSERDGAAIGDRIHHAAAQRVEARLGSVPASDASFTARAAEILRSSDHMHAA